jgi:hypothetical protein
VHRALGSGQVEDIFRKLTARPAVLMHPIVEAIFEGKRQHGNCLTRDTKCFGTYCRFMLSPGSYLDS